MFNHFASFTKTTSPPHLQAADGAAHRIDDSPEEAPQGWGGGKAVALLSVGSVDSLGGSCYF